MTNQLRRQVVPKFANSLNLMAISKMDPEEIRHHLTQKAQQLVEAEQPELDAATIQHVAEQVLDEVFGLGPLEPLLRDSSIVAIDLAAVDTARVQRADTWIETPVYFDDASHLRRTAERLCDSQHSFPEQWSVDVQLDPVHITIRRPAPAKETSLG